MNFTITSGQILGVLALIGSIYTVYKFFKELDKPREDKFKQIEENTKNLEEDNKRLNELESSNKMILQCLLVILNHDITGNGIENMKKTRDELQEYLVHK